MTASEHEYSTAADIHRTPVQRIEKSLLAVVIVEGILRIRILRQGQRAGPNPGRDALERFRPFIHIMQIADQLRRAVTLTNKRRAVASDHRISRLAGALHICKRHRDRRLNVVHLLPGRSCVAPMQSGYLKKTNTLCVPCQYEWKDGWVIGSSPRSEALLHASELPRGWDK